MYFIETTWIHIELISRLRTFRSNLHPVVQNYFSFWTLFPALLSRFSYTCTWLQSLKSSVHHGIEITLFLEIISRPHDEGLSVPCCSELTLFRTLSNFYDQICLPPDAATGKVQPSAFIVRRQPSPESVSTVEAVARILDLWEPQPEPNYYQQVLLKPLHRICQVQRAWAEQLNPESEVSWRHFTQEW